MILRWSNGRLLALGAGALVALVGALALAICRSPTLSRTERSAKLADVERGVVLSKYIGSERGWWVTLIRLGGRPHYHAIVCAAGLGRAKQLTYASADRRVMLAEFGSFRTVGLYVDPTCTEGELLMEAW
jgi:hypothetical protein